MTAFEKEYGPYERMDEQSLDSARMAELYQKNASWEWRLGNTPAFDIELGRRFDWGELQLHLCAKDGRITAAAAYSDSMDEDLISRLAPALTGVRFTSADMAAALVPLGGDAPEIAAWLTSKNF